MAIDYSTFFCFVLVCLQEVVNSAYLGKSLGKLSEYHHGVSGEVFAVDGRTLHIKDFTYDGEGPAAYFWAGSTRAVDNQGFRIRDENGRPDVLRKYRKEGVTITLPEGKTLRDIKWFSVWCEEFEVNFGDVKIARNFDFPKPKKLAPLQGVHGISSNNVVIVDAQTILIEHLSYDGEAPDAKFWAGAGPKPSPQGIRIPDENGKETPLRKYGRKTVVLTLPGDLTIFDIGHFGIWCEAFTVDFGHIQIPAGLNVPPSLKMLGVSPQSKLNCEVLHEELPFEVRWAIAGENIVVQLVARLEPREYMSFGVSGEYKKSKMIGGDVAVASIDPDTLQGTAEDYYLKDKSQCSGPTGSCPDERFKSGTNSIKTLNSVTVNGYSIVTYRRPLKASDEYDKPIFTNDTQAIIWAIGPLNQLNEVSFHNYYTRGDFLLDFGRQPKWNCPMPESDQPKVIGMTEEPLKQKQVPVATEELHAVQPIRSRNSERRRGPTRGESSSPDKEVDRPSTRRPSERRRGSNTSTQKSPIASREIPTPAPVKKTVAWEIPPIQCNEPEDGVFYAQMGPTGGKHGYPAITGHVGWGISWYINGLLIPEINVVRGKTYTFVVEGGLDPEVPARYHPFYITDDPIGGYEYKTPEERQSIKIFAGTTGKEGKVIPTGIGRLCHWTHQGDKEADDFESFGAYQRTLELKCDQGEPGVIQWTPNKDTPDTVYYQCFTHRYLGWKINVHDRCDLDGEGSELKPIYAFPDKEQIAVDLEASPSINVETRAKPNYIVEYQKSYPTQHADLRVPAQQPEPYYRQEELNLSPPPFILIPVDTYINHSYYAPRPVDSFSQLTYQNGPLRTQHIPTKVLRRPVPHNRPLFMNKNHRTNRPNHVDFKKPLYKPLTKAPMTKRPVIKYENTKPLSDIMVPPVANIALLPPIYVDTNKKQEQLLNVDISPLQASTEREPNSTYEINLLPAINTGFHPETIVIEGGFRPIIRKEIEHRVSEQDGPELNYESSIGVIDVHPERMLHPVFRSSPTGGLKKHANKINKRASTKKDIRLIVKRPRSQEFESSNEDIKTEATERVESYYLPPTNKKPDTKDSPPETVITYDGKKVSGASLSIRINESPSPRTDTRTSKASDLLKSTPQFTLFKGELPPLNEAYIDLNAPQLKSKVGLNRNLDTPDLPSPTTRLRPIRSGSDEPKQRSKRSPHHTPEHTEEQKRTTKSSGNLVKSSYVVIITFLVAINLN